MSSHYLEGHAAAVAEVVWQSAGVAGGEHLVTVVLWQDIEVAVARVLVVSVPVLHVDRQHPVACTHTTPQLWDPC